MAFNRIGFGLNRGQQISKSRDEIAGQCTGGTINDHGGYRSHKFTASGQFTVNVAAEFAPISSRQIGGGATFQGLDTVDFMVIAGGAGGGDGRGGGGGAGGLRTSSPQFPGPSASKLKFPSGGYWPVIIGGGGAGGASCDQQGTDGAPSSLNSGPGGQVTYQVDGSTTPNITSTGGGAGGSAWHSKEYGRPGGSGGGAGGGSGYPNNRGNSVDNAGQGYNGGHAQMSSLQGAGGGGAAGAGANTTGTTSGGNGGSAVDITMYTPSNINYAGGGGGGGDSNWNTGGGASAGNGGNPGTGAQAGQDGTGGGGGGSYCGRYSGKGGDGVVIIRYTL